MNENKQNDLSITSLVILCNDIKKVINEEICEMTKTISSADFEKIMKSMKLHFSELTKVLFLINTKKQVLQ